MSSVLIKISPEESNSAINFGYEILQKKAQSSKDFGSGITRGHDDNLVDVVEGKIAEVAFSKHFKEVTGHTIEVDYKIYPGLLEIDYGQDLDVVSASDSANHFIRCKVDIKATRKYSKWLLVEGHKFWADAYVLIKVDVPSDSEKNLSAFLDHVKTNNVNAQICGFAYHFDLVHNESKRPFILFNQNESLVRTENFSKISDWTPDGIQTYIKNNKAEFAEMPVKLKSPKNFGLPIEKLRSSSSEWKSFFDWILNSKFPK